MMSSPKISLRAQLIKLLIAVQEGNSLSKVQPYFFERIDPKDRALLHELSSGVLRQWFALKQVTLPLLERPVSDPHIETALYVGIYQILCTRIADHAAISETVSAIKQLGFESASGLVNAILRRVTREREALEEQFQHAHGLPSWLYKRLKKDWPEHLEQLAQQLRTSAPLTLRVNQRMIGRDAYLNKLLSEGIQARACTLSEAGVVIEQSVHIPSLVGYDAGWFSVQDEHAQLCASLVPNLDEKDVIDACAAPGGKTAHLLEKYRPHHLIALDLEATRLLRVEENLQRLKLADSSVRILASDASTWQSAKPVDCIVLDAPCSAIGVMRRHPDIRLLRQSSDIQNTVALQRDILKNMWQQLKPQGHLLYITCSILKAENEQQMQHFFAEHTNAQEIKLPVDWGIEQHYGRQLLPEAGKGDGFYYCLIQKIS